MDIFYWKETVRSTTTLECFNDVALWVDIILGQDDSYDLYFSSYLSSKYILEHNVCEKFYRLEDAKNYIEKIIQPHGCKIVDKDLLVFS
jgi:hypothetical protein